MGIIRFQNLPRVCKLRNIMSLSHLIFAEFALVKTNVFSKAILQTLVPTPQNGQSHSKNSSAICRHLFDHFVGLALKGLSGLQFQRHFSSYFWR